MTGRMKPLCILITLAMCLLGSFQLEAQTEPVYTDVVYLKNGSMFKARIIDYKQGDTITIEIAGGHILKFADSEIDKIQQLTPEMERPVVVRERRKAIPRDSYPVQGPYAFGNSAFSGQTSGVNGATASIINFEAGGGYQFNKWLGVGLGTGYNLYDVNRGESVIPLYAEYRMYPLKKNLGPYFHMITGYGFALKDESFGIQEAKGGYLFHPAIGWRVAAGKTFFFTFDIGTRFQKAEFTQDNLWWLPGTAVRDILYKRTTFRIGIQMW